MLCAGVALWADSSCGEEGSWQLLVRSRYLHLACGPSQGSGASLEQAEGGLCMKLRLAAGALCQQLTGH